MMTRRMSRMFPEFALAPEVGRFVESLLQPATGPAVQPVFPALNVWEDEDGFTVEAELPGYAMSGLEIGMTGNELTIAGSREEATPENATVHRRERSGGRFTRTVRIGVPIDADKVSATFENGVLSVLLPKSAAAKPRRIEVKSA